MHKAHLLFRAVTLIAGLTVTAPALAHHGWSEYDTGPRLTLTGHHQGGWLVVLGQPLVFLKGRCQFPTW